MDPTTSSFFAHERIADLMRASSDIHRGPEGASVASRITGAFSGPLSSLVNRTEHAASAIVGAVASRRPAART
jgi:hypothetical protein